MGDAVFPVLRINVHEFPACLYFFDLLIDGTEFYTLTGSNNSLNKNSFYVKGFGIFSYYSIGCRSNGFWKCITCI